MDESDDEDEECGDHRGHEIRRREVIAEVSHHPSAGSESTVGHLGRDEHGRGSENHGDDDSDQDHGDGIDDSSTLREGVDEHEDDHGSEQCRERCRGGAEDGACQKDGEGDGESGAGAESHEIRGGEWVAEERLEEYACNREGGSDDARGPDSSDAESMDEVVAGDPPLLKVAEASGAGHESERCDEEQSEQECEQDEDLTAIHS